MRKPVTAFLFACIIISCHHRPAETQHECSGYHLYEGTITDTELITLKDLSYKTIETELSLRSFVPDSTRMNAKPNTYIAAIAEVANWSKEESDRVFKETSGHLYLDTADRDFEKYWYNTNGLLCKYEIRSFGDMRHNEVCFSWYPNHTIECISINDVVTDRLKYKNKTIKFNADGQVTILSHNVVPKISGKE